MNKTLIVNTFRTEELSGSPQHLHFFDSHQGMKTAFDEIIVNDEFDHSFVYLKENQEAEVLWKNKAGSIQFCGSGAYAVSWYLYQERNITSINLISKAVSLKAELVDQNVCLAFSKQNLEEEGQFRGHDIYYTSKVGIFLLKLKDVNMLTDDLSLHAIKDELDVEYKNRIHGLCFFSFYENKGYLRYLCPWHGRSEDYVTGSIHQYLSPLVHKLYGRSKQEWHQLSTSSGKLYSLCDGSMVSIWGDCKLQN